MFGRNKAATREQVAALEKKVDKIMATQTQLAAVLRTNTTLLTDLVGGMDKIGTETDAILKEVQDLKDAAANQDNASPELQEAVAAVAAAAESLQRHVKDVDDKIPDEITPLPPVGLTQNQPQR